MLKITKGLDITKIINDLTNKVGSGITLSLKELKVSIDEKTPEDTGLLIDNNHIVPVEINGNIVIGSIVNNTEYAREVEYGLPYVKNYHKRVGGNKVTIFHSGDYKGLQGDRAFARATDETEKDIVNIIKKSITGL